nr:PREDICTED: uncharacterized protein LOC106705905 [Latimeria chalumnae]|eukprot:XP_014351504.1 PREDICTED: uncharacterized protein LOC106705905 [Latimeria chalumnae]
MTGFFCLPKLCISTEVIATGVQEKKIKTKDAEEENPQIPTPPRSAERTCVSEGQQKFCVNQKNLEQWLKNASNYEREAVYRMGRTLVQKHHLHESERQQLYRGIPLPKQPRYKEIPFYRYEGSLFDVVKKERRFHYIINPEFVSETSLVRPKSYYWPVPPSRALH